MNVYTLFLNRARAWPARVALVHEGRPMRYDELARSAGRTARALAAQGLRPGDRVALLSENRAEYVQLLLGAAALGVIVACQNWRQSPTELRHCITLVRPQLVICSARFAPLLADARVDALVNGEVPVLNLDQGHEAWLQQGQRAGDVPLGQADAEAGLFILYTSGTTGLPKGALISHRASMARACIAALDQLLVPGDAFIAWTPMFHMLATDSTLTTLLGGGTVFILDGLDLPALRHLVQTERIGHLVVIPGMVDKAIEAFSAPGFSVKGVRGVGCMADLVPPAQIEAITRLVQAPFLNSFGATETGSAPASAGLLAPGQPVHDLSKRQSSLCLIRLVDDEGSEVGPDQPGEMQVSGPGLFSGYCDYQAHADGGARLRQGDWFAMGDMFTRSADGLLHYVDRKKYLIKSGGENIYPAEIERVLGTLPGVADAVVIRQPDAQWGEVPVAYVVAADPALDAATLIARCRGQIAGYKLPREVVFVRADELPRNATGKVQRNLLEAAHARRRAGGP
ncbi:class I adenylate-forming enzyme family protein [Xenophilus arseniciresistens]|uniref:Class I adenylate-forming enzyme family protein n=1 Tax=Xenophilus arseniciresistens TaxID=1283306 RepID=A0AAE3N7I8_9BURK|nr:class I adenylate-forming enzyme family protein [Xenophilus arseniciresistens]MDA7416008.1 class I adenylate-forming enzyme family protein [Xenophilus arseniciresistens]